MPEVNLLCNYPKAKRNLPQRSAATQEDKDIACRYGKEYFDGDRNHGYGGYRYDGRWRAVAQTFIEQWQLTPGDRVLDIGCAKGFFVKDLMLECPGLEVFGIDISEYAALHCEPEVVGRLHVGNALKLPFPDKSFRAVTSINTIHNLTRSECLQAIQEMQRVSSEHCYIQVDAYRTQEEREIFLNWVLTAKTYGFPHEWKEIFDEAEYRGDYYWTIIG